ncbi:MAG: hypothetical protein AAF226_19055, partial [Verrucomicrobiota bacterium]
MTRKEKRRALSEALIFAWASKPRTWMALTGFAIFSLIMHIAGSYFFQVKYPVPANFEVQTDQLTVLDPSDPGVRRHLQRLEDRTIFLRPPSENSEARVGTDALSVRFQPSFIESQPRLKVRAADDMDIQPLYVPGAESTPLPQRYQLVLDKKLSARGVAPESVLSDYLDLIRNVPSMEVDIEV